MQPEVKTSPLEELFEQKGGSHEQHEDLLAVVSEYLGTSEKLLVERCTDSLAEAKAYADALTASGQEEFCRLEAFVFSLSDSLEQRMGRMEEKLALATATTTTTSRGAQQGQPSEPQEIEPPAPQPAHGRFIALCSAADLAAHEVTAAQGSGGAASAEEEGCVSVPPTPEWAYVQASDASVTKRRADFQHRTFTRETVDSSVGETTRQQSLEQVQQDLEAFRLEVRAMQQQMQRWNPGHVVGSGRPQQSTKANPSPGGEVAAAAKEKAVERSLPGPLGSSSRAPPTGTLLSSQRRVSDGSTGAFSQEQLHKPPQASACRPPPRVQPPADRHGDQQGTQEQQKQPQKQHTPVLPQQQAQQQQQQLSARTGIPVIRHASPNVRCVQLPKGMQSPPTMISGMVSPGAPLGALPGRTCRDRSPLLGRSPTPTPISCRQASQPPPGATVMLCPSAAGCSRAMSPLRTPGATVALPQSMPRAPAPMHVTPRCRLASPQPPLRA